MTIIGMDTVVYGVEDLAKAREFFGDWGLKKLSGSKLGTNYETLQGTRVVVKQASAKGLAPTDRKGSTVREVIWGVKTKRDLAAIARELAKDRDVTEDKDGVIHSMDPNGFGIGFRVWRGRSIKPTHQRANAPGARGRVSKMGHFYDRARPARLGHVVFDVPDFAECAAFYTDRLGFVVSDRIKGRAVYLRCNAESDHHNLFFMKADVARARFNHLAFEVRDIHELFGGGMFLKDRGWTTEVGPGRHPASSAYFWYFENPCGGAAEYFADSDWLDARWKPRMFEPRPAHFAEWLLADGIDRYLGHR